MRMLIRDKIHYRGIYVANKQQSATIQKKKKKKPAGHSFS